MPFSAFIVMRCSHWSVVCHFLLYSLEMFPLVCCVSFSAFVVVRCFRKSVVCPSEGCCCSHRSAVCHSVGYVCSGEMFP